MWRNLGVLGSNMEIFSILPILVTFFIMSLIGENLHIFIIKPLNFTISWRMYHYNESNHQQLIIFVYFLIIHKILSVRFWCYRVYILHNGESGKTVTLSHLACSVTTQTHHVLQDIVKFRGFRIKHEDFLLLKTL